MHEEEFRNDSYNAGARGLFVSDDIVRRIVSRNKIVLVLRERGLTIKEAAREYNVPYNALSGAIEHPEETSRENLYSIAEKLEVDVSGLL